MSKPLRITEEFVEECRKELEKRLREQKISTGSFTFTKNLPNMSGQKANIYMTPEAWCKMFLLVDTFSTEVQWHATAKKLGIGEYEIDDVLCFPQVVTSTTVNVNTEEYTPWLFNLTDEQFNNLKVHCHSHVNMGVTPSGTDISHQEEVVSSIAEDSFYIFLICNKKRDINARIYDLADNILYETQDVTVNLWSEGFDFADFVKTSKDIVKTKTYNYTGSFYKGTQTQTATAKNDKNTETKVQSIVPVKGGKEYDDSKKKDGKGSTTSATKPTGGYLYDEDDDADDLGQYCFGCKSKDCYNCDMPMGYGYGAFDDGYDGYGYRHVYGRHYYG